MTAKFERNQTLYRKRKKKIKPDADPFLVPRQTSAINNKVKEKISCS